MENCSVILKKTPKDGVFPDLYYTTTNLKMQVMVDGEWFNVEKIEMDKGIRIDKHEKKAECITGNEVLRGDLIVVGEKGIRVIDEQQNSKIGCSDFAFMSNDISAERQKRKTIALVAKKMREIKRRKGRILFVVGPAVIHAGAGKYLEKLVIKGYVDCLFSGNGFATHDIEQNLFKTALGISTITGYQKEGGYHHHLWVINTIRKHGSIKHTIDSGVLKGGVMYHLVKHNIPFVLAGSIRDDGPLPETISNTIEAQKAMRRQIWRGFDLVIICASTLHAIATGNLLPAKIMKVVVDVNPASVIKLIDRGTTGSWGIITDVEFFLSELVIQLGRGK